MGFRASIGDVQAILGRNYNGKTDLLPFIRQANALVNRCNAALTTYKPWYGTLDSAGTSKEIEILLAAHKYMMADPGYTQRSTGKSSGSFQVQSGKSGLERTDYGKEALLMDDSGILEAFDKRKFAHGFWAGTPWSLEDDTSTD